MWGVGIGSYNWSSTVNGAGSVLLHFYVAYLNPRDAYNRGYGFQLRCLSE
ncbi:hypothetical protein [uncultured Rikenella sp.]|nr:hypothetical protein [uncultured Rikenella sp.]